MSEEDRIAGIQQRLQTGLGNHATADSRQRSVQLADALVSLAEEEDLEVPFEEDTELDQVTGSVDNDTLQSIRKVAELIEDDLGVNIGHSKFARLATTAGQLNSLTSVVLAGYTLLVSAEALDQAADEASVVENIEQDLFVDFYSAITIFAIECFLFTTPFNYTIAWRGTRYINNRLLYRLRTYSSNLYRLALSEVHFAIREIVPTALRSAEEFSSYLVSMTVRTIEMFETDPDTSVGDLPSEIESILSEYIEFVEEAYNLVTPDIDVQSLVDDILIELGDFLDVSNLSATQVTSEASRL